MDSRQLTDAQLAAMRRALSAHCRYVSKLVERMEQVGWSHEDHLYVAAKRARAGAEELAMALHYAGCAGAGYERLSTNS